MLSVVLVLAAFPAQSQLSHFTFDLNGNLTRQAGQISQPPQILQHPQNQVVATGEPASFSVVVANTVGLSYQWRFNSTDIPGATTDSILITNCSLANQGLYSVVLVNNSGSVTSAPAALMLDGDVDGLPNSWELANFGSLAQSGSGDYDGDGVSNADEFQDGTDPTDSASAHFRLNILANGGLVESVPSQLKYTNGQVVTLTAIAYAPEIFHGWTGDVIARTNIVTVTMTSNKTVVAHFQPLVLVWANLAGGSWHEPTNWEPPLVPTLEDLVLITNSSPTITLNEPADCATLIVGTTGGGSNPALSGSGTLIIHTNATWSFGHMNGGGRTVVAPGATLIINSPPSSVHLNSWTLDNGGTVRMTGVSGITLDNAVITNRPGALFHVQSVEGQFAVTFGSGGGVSRIDNAGTFRKTSSSTTRVSGSISFNNRGVVELPGGSLDLFGGGAHSGSFDVPAGRTLILSAGTHTANASSSISGAGNLTVNNGTVTLAGLVNLGGTHTFNGGTINVSGNYTCTNNTLVIGGGGSTVNFNGTGVIAPSLLTLSAGTLGGSSIVTALSQATWSAGVMSGSGRTVISPGATLSINGSVSLAGRTLDNSGTVLWSGAGSIAMSSAVITNGPGALFRSLSAGLLSFGSGVNRFDNAGTFHHVASGVMSVFGAVTFNNYGAAEIRNGTLTLNGGGLNNGTMDVWAPATLQFAGGTFNASAASSITGAGKLTVGAGTATLAGLVHLEGPYTFSGGGANLTGNYICTNNTITIGQGTANFSGTGVVQPTILTQSGGVLTGNNTVTILNQMSWSAGTMSGSGRTIIPPGATLSISGANGISLSGRTLDNAGTLLWTATGPMALNNAVITNRPGALFEAQSGAPITLSGGVNRIDNAGTFRKTAAATTTIFGGISLNNFGTLELQKGIIAANGGYNTSPNALLHCGIGGLTAGSGYGRLQVSGAVALNGALSVAFVNGFQPVTNDSFTVVTAGTRTGTFASFSYPSNAVTMQLSNAPNAVIARVTGLVTNVPQPRLLSAEIVGPDVRLTWTAVSNATYRLEFKPDPITTNWTPRPGDITATSNTVSTLDALTISNRFYRIRVIP